METRGCEMVSELLFSLSSLSVIRRPSVRTRPQSSKVESDASHSWVLSSAHWPAPAHSHHRCSLSSAHWTPPTHLLFVCLFFLHVSTVSKISESSYWLEHDLKFLVPFLTFALKKAPFSLTCNQYRMLAFCLLYCIHQNEKPFLQKSGQSTVRFRQES